MRRIDGANFSHATGRHSKRTLRQCKGCGTSLLRAASSGRARHVLMNVGSVIAVLIFLSATTCSGLSTLPRKVSWSVSTLLHWAFSAALHIIQLHPSTPTAAKE